jgi:multidrug efflux system membrane fusion protein
MPVIPLSKHAYFFRHKSLLIGAVLAALGVAAYFYWPHHRAPARAEAAQPVVVADVVAKAVPIQISTIGHVQTIASVAVRARIDGQISKVLVHDGQDVVAGDELFELDDRQARAQLAQAQGTLMKDNAQLRFAKQEINRVAPLVSKNIASRQQLEQVQANQGALEGSVKADEAQVANIEAQLSYTSIRAPIDGRLGTIALKEGNTIQSNSTAPLVMINQLHPIYVTFAVPQSDLARIQEAMEAAPVKVTAVAPDSGEAPETGEIAYIENAIDAASNTLSVKAKFTNPHERLWPGQFVNVVITLRVEPEALVVPSETVQTGQQGFYVYVVKPDMTVELRNVGIGQVANNQTVITKGLSKDEKVVTTGQLRLKNGTKVKVDAGPGAQQPLTGSNGDEAVLPGAPS